MYDHYNCLQLLDRPCLEEDCPASTLYPWCTTWCRRPSHLQYETRGMFMCLGVSCVKDRKKNGNARGVALSMQKDKTSCSPSKESSETFGRSLRQGLISVAIAY